MVWGVGGGKAKPNAKTRERILHITFKKKDIQNTTQIVPSGEGYVVGHSRTVLLSKSEAKNCDSGSRKHHYFTKLSLPNSEPYSEMMAYTGEGGSAVTTTHGQHPRFRHTLKSSPFVSNGNICP